MSTTADGFLAEIRANPLDDTPHLIYADWLDENGQEEWAELIRSQVAKPGFSERGKTLATAAIVKLLGRNNFAKRLLSFEWQRGMIVGTFCSLPWWLKYGDRLLAAHPVDQVIIHQTSERSMDRLAELYIENGGEWPTEIGTLKPSVQRQAYKVWPLVKKWELRIGARSDDHVLVPYGDSLEAREHQRRMAREYQQRMGLVAGEEHT